MRGSISGDFRWCCWQQLLEVRRSQGLERMADPSLTGHRWSFAGGKENISALETLLVWSRPAVWSVC